MITLDIPEGWYGSQNDEAAFFQWLDKIGCVASYRGLHKDGLDLVCVELTTDTLSEPDLRELIALHHRYGRDMSRLACFRTEQNEKWFAAPGMYWHEPVFGSRAGDKV